ncbi:AbrB/MazE/SpoVT family DNA-binding domain-containing protein [Granulicella cerasi]|uniref:AbrB/MazE/SpoVT family DNA-binding domain-containing protein n=1 Tax=Granulicella cerasi TaxID=741063 RepID=A0ABW1Z9J8_9BACT|nr:AbrB/MazE/SpoVT family DNA-binding domain-containing protein [Granulicella cerasi]
MLTANLRKVGGSVMVAIPPALMELAELKANMDVTLTVKGDAIVIRKTPRRYSLAELVKQGDRKAKRGSREWVDAPAVGKELL